MQQDEALLESLLEQYEPLEDEDAASLLALVDLDDLNDAEDVDLPAPASAAEAERQVKRSRKKADGFHPNRSREKRKEEIVYLRSRVRDMETRLAQLQQDAGTQRSAIEQPSSAIVAAASSPSASIATSMWEQIASRQSSARRKAELENVRLKLILEGQIKVARGLEKLLSKRSNSIELSVESGYQFKRLCRQIVPVNDEASIFEMLSRSVASAIGHVDAVFAANGLSRTERDLQDSRVCRNSDKGGGMFMELFANKMMPFPLHAAADVVWEHYTRSNKSVPSRSYSQKLMNMSDGTIFEQFDVQMQGKRSAAGLHVHKVSRRFVQEDRVVIVWRSVVDQIQFTSDSSLDGLRFQEHSYVVIKKPRTMPSDSYSLVQTCFLMIPEIDAGASADSNNNGVGRITDFLLQSFARYTHWSHQMIENCLLDRCLRPKQSH